MDITITIDDSIADILNVYLQGFIQTVQVSGETHNIQKYPQGLTDWISEIVQEKQAAFAPILKDSVAEAVSIQKQISDLQAQLEAVVRPAVSVSVAVPITRTPPILDTPVTPS